MTKEGTTIIANFMTPAARVLKLRRGNISYYNEYLFSSTL